MKPIQILALSASIASAAPDGEQLFTTNCSVCHMLDQMLVGPSLAEIRTLYDGKPDEFVKWSVAPQRKRPNVIEMPSMVHVGEEGLRAIHEHVMKVSKGVKVREQKEGDPFAGSPPHVARPQVQRIFMPDAGPAAIAIALDGNVSLCWDAGECRLRYVWTGGFIDGHPYWKGNGSSQAKIIGKVRYKESSAPIPLGEPSEFLGYRMEKGLPVLRYRIGPQYVTETFSPLPDGAGFSRKFTLDPPLKDAQPLTFPSDQNITYTSDKGKWSGSNLTLQAADTAEFTVTFSLK